ncbi:hypothetical protein GCM10023208_34650 [Erythrobacter westpacificensis]|jgi:hypothetical protein|uniref:Uncharacterized protein n=1 Tax=Erythrobacter westpacificensis TaxID=1055231 RepID=A0ABP9KTU9_9SPHN
MKRAIVATINGVSLVVEVEDNPLGWRWWSWTEWDADDWAPLAQHRIVPLTELADSMGRRAWLCGLEGGGFRLLGAFRVFPILEQNPDEARAFVERLFVDHAREPALF